MFFFFCSYHKLYYYNKISIQPKLQLINILYITYILDIIIINVRLNPKIKVKKYLVCTLDFHVRQTVTNSWHAILSFYYKTITWHKLSLELSICSHQSQSASVQQINQSHCLVKCSITFTYYCLTNKQVFFSYLFHIYAHVDVVCVYITFLYFTFLLAKKIGAIIYLLRDSMFVCHCSCVCIQEIQNKHDR